MAPPVRSHCAMSELPDTVLVQELGARGRGLVAARAITRGQLILRDEAAVTVRMRSAGGGAEMEAVSEEIQRQVDALSSEDQEQFYKLTRRYNNHHHNLTEAYYIFLNNNIKGQSRDKCLYLNMSLINHSCIGNSDWRGADLCSNVLELYANRDIEAGEEVTTSYLDTEHVLLPVAERQRLLLSWGFLCTCSLCRRGDLKQKEELVIETQIRRLMDQKATIFTKHGMQGWDDDELASKGPDVIKKFDSEDISTLARIQEEILNNLQKLDSAAGPSPQLETKPEKDLHSGLRGHNRSLFKILDILKMF